MNKGIILCWYFHLPSVTSDDEIIDAINYSIIPLLQSHFRTKKKFSIAITGSLLKRISEIDNSVLELLRALLNEGLVEILGSFYYEIYPPAVPLSYLKEHVKKDLTVKEELLGERPVSFYVPNFTWVSVLELILSENRYQNCLLDFENFKYSTNVQTWKWSTFNNLEMKTVLENKFMLKGEGNLIYYTEYLNYIFRDNFLVKRFCFGNNNVLHDQMKPEMVDEFVVDLFSQMNDNKFLTLCDDGDRINPVSYLNYEYFLEKLDEDICTFPGSVNSKEINKIELNYMPSSTISKHYEFWMKDIDSIMYKQLLDEVYLKMANCNCPDKKETVLELQDVYFFFWKTISRKKYYLKKLYELLNS
ncbi:MAG: hypothetical protein GY790_03130 [Bacteroidetes bacterium]|nr:hypothetical protein [Bacteroidota bacterium]